MTTTTRKASAFVASATLTTFAALTTLGCGSRAQPVCGTPPGTGSPTSIDVPPAAAVAAPAIPIATAPADAPTASVGDALPLEIAIDRTTVCARAAGRIHCTSDLSQDRALTGSPAVEGVDDAISLALGRNFGCAVTRAGAVMCWGENSSGQLGAKLRDDRSPKAVAVVGITGARRVVAGGRHACAVLADGRVACWGANESGQTGSATSYLPPAHELIAAEPVARLSGVTGLAAAESTTCAAGSRGETWCWGRPLFTAGGASSRANQRPDAVRALAGFTSLSTSDHAFCGVRAGEVLCWGELYSLVPGGSGGQKEPVSTGLRRATQVRVAGYHACALLTDGTVSCFGSDDSHALGRPPGTDPAASANANDRGPLRPATVAGLPFAVDVAAGGSMSCAVTSARDVYCWGSWPRGGGTATRVEPVPVKIRVFE